MTRGHNLDGLMRFVGRGKWAKAFQDVLGEHFGVALDTFDLDYDDLADLLGEDWAATLWGCAFEDFLTRRIGPRGENVVDDYLKRHGKMESAQGRRYLAGLRSSFMSLYEVSDIIPGESFRARDVIRDSDPVLVHEHTGTQSLKLWDKIGARLIDLGDRTVMAGGLLSFSQEAGDTLVRGLNGGEAANDQPPGPAPHVTEDALRQAAPLLTTAWLLDVLPKALGDLPAMVNSDGEEPVFHKYHYPMAKGVRQKDIAARLNTIGALSPVRAKIWNWLESGSATVESEIAVEARTLDGEIILGHVELEGRFLIVTTGSVSRAGRITAMVEDALGDWIGEPKVRIETLDDWDDEEADEAADDMEIPPEIAASVVQGFLDRHYRQVLDEPVPMLGGLSPRAAAGGGDDDRAKVADWLKYLENQGGKTGDPNDPMATYDFAWMWTELCIEDLRC